MVEHGISRQWPGHGPLERFVDSHECRCLNLGLSAVVPQAKVGKVADQTVDWVVRSSRPQILGGDVAGWVVGRGVGTESVHVRLDERRPSAPEGQLAGLVYGIEHSRSVVPVDTYTGDSVPDGAIGQTFCCRLLV